MPPITEAELLAALAVEHLLAANRVCRDAADDAAVIGALRLLAGLADDTAMLCADPRVLLYSLAAASSPALVVGLCDRAVDRLVGIKNVGACGRRGQHMGGGSIERASWSPLAAAPQPPLPRVARPASSADDLAELFKSLQVCVFAAGGGRRRRGAPVSQPPPFTHHHHPPSPLRTPSCSCW